MNYVRDVNCVDVRVVEEEEEEDMEEGKCLLNEKE